MTPQEMVREFHEKFRHPVNDKPALVNEDTANLRYDLIHEEFAELWDAIHDNDLVEIADALADITYVVYGAALVYGIDLDEVIREVHRSNMSKLGADGEPIYREDGKILKGPGFEEPRIAQVLGIDSEETKEED